MRGLIVTIGVIAAGCWFLSLDRPYATEQTWPESYDVTTCAQWRNEMSDDQRTAAAADLLEQALEPDGSTEPPSLRQVTDWTELIDRACVEHPRLTIEAAQTSSVA